MKKIIGIVLAAILAIYLYMQIGLSATNIAIVVIVLTCASGCAIILCLKAKYGM